MIGVVAYFRLFFFTQKSPPPAAVIDFLCKARIQNFQLNAISVRRGVERNCQTHACSDPTGIMTEDIWLSANCQNVLSCKGIGSVLVQAKTINFSSWQFCFYLMDQTRTKQKLLNFYALNFSGLEKMQLQDYLRHVLKNR